MKKKHIILLIIGTIFILLGCFHTNLWFDETYSVCLANHNFGEIWTITSHDVHPPMYYWILRIFNLIFGQKIIIYRLVSAIAIIICAILGYTHIRKDFGEKSGIIFSFLTFFFPIMCMYANEIRMYSLSMLFVTLTFIYANRIIKDSKLKNWFIFAICSLMSAYMHYYALVAIGIINLGLLIILIKSKQIDKIKKFFIFGIGQIILYLPWAFCFLRQLLQVSKGFWIKVEFPKTLIEIVNFQFNENLNTITMRHQYISFVVAILFFIYVLLVLYKNRDKKEEILPGVLAIGLYVLIILIIRIISYKAQILYARYLFTITGILILGISIILSKVQSKKILIAFGIVILGFALYNNINLIRNNYSNTNMKQIEYLKENIKEDDIIIYSDIGPGSVIATFFPNNKIYFYNPQNWGVEEAYKAFAPQMKLYITLDFLENYKGRIWLIDLENEGLYKENFSQEPYKFISSKIFKTKYQNYVYDLILIEKERERTTNSTRRSSRINKKVWKTNKMDILSYTFYKIHTFLFNLSNCIIGFFARYITMFNHRI